MSDTVTTHEMVQVHVSQTRSEACEETDAPHATKMTCESYPGSVASIRPLELLPRLSRPAVYWPRAAALAARRASFSAAMRSSRSSFAFSDASFFASAASLPAVAISS